MADYFTHFSCLLDVGTPENAARALDLYGVGGRLWFAYPKKTGPVRTDLDRDHGWEPLTQAGLLPVTQVPLDATWSALRFRLREEIPTLTRKT